MSDYRDPNDPMYGNTGYEPADRRDGTSWGWIAGAVFLVIVLALAFGVALRRLKNEPMSNVDQVTKVVMDALVIVLHWVLEVIPLAVFGIITALVAHGRLHDFIGLAAFVLAVFLGRRIYAVGSNLEATRLSGVNTNRVKLAIFALMGLMCAFGGLVETARLAAGSPSAGTTGELDAIAACFIGGTSMRGGSGTVYGALIGALVMASLDNGMSMLDVDSYWQMIVKGGILVLAVWVDVISGSNQR